MSNPESENATYTAAEVAARFGVAEGTILRNAAAGTLPFPAVRIGRRVRFPRAGVDAALGVLMLPAESGRGPVRAVRGGAVVELRKG